MATGPPFLFEGIFPTKQVTIDDAISPPSAALAATDPIPMTFSVFFHSIHNSPPAMTTSAHSGNGRRKLVSSTHSSPPKPNPHSMAIFRPTHPPRLFLGKVDISEKELELVCIIDILAPHSTFTDGTVNTVTPNFFNFPADQPSEKSVIRVFFKYSNFNGYNYDVSRFSIISEFSATNAVQTLNSAQFRAFLKSHLERGKIYYDIYCSPYNLDDEAALLEAIQGHIPANPGHPSDSDPAPLLPVSPYTIIPFQLTFPDRDILLIHDTQGLRLFGFNITFMLLEMVVFVSGAGEDGFTVDDIDGTIELIPGNNLFRTSEQPKVTEIWSFFACATPFDRVSLPTAMLYTSAVKLSTIGPNEALIDNSQLVAARIRSMGFNQIFLARWLKQHIPMTLNGLQAIIEGRTTFPHAGQAIKANKTTNFTSQLYRVRAVATSVTNTQKKNSKTTYTVRFDDGTGTWFTNNLSISTIMGNLNEAKAFKAGLVVDLYIRLHRGSLVVSRLQFVSNPPLHGYGRGNACDLLTFPSTFENSDYSTLIVADVLAHHYSLVKKNFADYFTLNPSLMNGLPTNYVNPFAIPIIAPELLILKKIRHHISLFRFTVHALTVTPCLDKRCGNRNCGDKIDPFDKARNNLIPRTGCYIVNRLFHCLPGRAPEVGEILLFTMRADESSETVPPQVVWTTVLPIGCDRQWIIDNFDLFDPDSSIDTRSLTTANIQQIKEFNSVALVTAAADEATVPLRVVPLDPDDKDITSEDAIVSCGHPACVGKTDMVSDFCVKYLAVLTPQNMNKLFRELQMKSKSQQTHYNIQQQHEQRFKKLTQAVKAKSTAVTNEKVQLIKIATQKDKKIAYLEAQLAKIKENSMSKKQKAAEKKKLEELTSMLEKVNKKIGPVQAFNQRCDTKISDLRAQLEEMKAIVKTAPVSVPEPLPFIVSTPIPERKIEEVKKDVLVKKAISIFYDEIREVLLLYGADVTPEEKTTAKKQQRKKAINLNESEVFVVEALFHDIMNQNHACLEKTLDKINPTYGVDNALLLQMPNITATSLKPAHRTLIQTLFAKKAKTSTLLQNLSACCDRSSLYNVYCHLHAHYASSAQPAAPAQADSRISQTLPNHPIIFPQVYDMDLVYKSAGQPALADTITCVYIDFQILNQNQLIQTWKNPLYQNAYNDEVQFWRGIAKRDSLALTHGLMHMVLLEALGYQLLNAIGQQQKQYLKKTNAIIAVLRKAVTVTEKNSLAMVVSLTAHKCAVCFEPQQALGSLLHSTCCKRMMVCSDCAVETQNTRCANCGVDNVHFATNPL